MSSTRSASPASDGGSPEPLTPRSKIRALLAAVDNGEVTSTRGTSTTPTRRRSPQLTSHALSVDGSEEESEDEIRPRGRLAARMHGLSAQAPEPSVENETKEQNSLPASQTASGADTQMMDTDGDELPVAPRRLQRKTREATPDTTQISARSPSPGLFVSSPAGPSPTKTAEQHSESEDDLPATKSDRFKALVERKKQERLAREAADEARKAERLAQQEKLSSELDGLVSDDGGDVSDIADDEGGITLTQKAKPTRKASKKAIEEMNRETQRMARNMQLAHEAKTRKKITKNSLFERFNFRPAGAPEPKTASSSRPGTPSSDVDMEDADTPPSSPPVEGEDKPAAEVALGAQPNQEVTEVVPVAEEEAPRPSTLDKGKGKAIDFGSPITTKTKRQVRVRFPQPAVNVISVDSDDELEVTTTEKDKLMAMFDNVPQKQAQGSHSMKALRALAHLGSPGKAMPRKKGASGMTAAELQFSLHQKAKEQARMERDRRLNVLKAQGVVVQTAEERERQMQEVEDIVAKAREEAEQIMQQEREEAKKDAKDGEHDPLAWDDSEDDDYEDRGNDADEEVSAVELSGSEDDEEPEGSDEEEAAGVMFDDAAEEEESESEETPEERTNEELIEADNEETPAARKRRPRKQAVVLSDDEDAAEVEATPRPKTTTQLSPTVPSVTTPGSVLRSAKKSFIPGMPVEGPAGLGLTQIFAGTMDDSQIPAATGPTQSMMPDFDSFPDSNFSATMDSPVPTTQNDDTQATTQGIQLNFSQTQMHGLDSLMQDVPGTQFTDMIEASQDAGFQERTPMKERFVDPPYSTVDTLPLGQEEPSQHDSPLIRRGRLRRKMDVSAAEKEPAPTVVASTPEPQTAFSAIKEGAVKEKKKHDMEEFNRKKSKAKEMVEEHAEESEDEYQGLGGYDGEDSDDESVASVKEMLDDAAGNDGDERKLAAFYADRERASDEKQVEQLFKDITNGMLRRKRGADYDLSDSDDGGEARRKMKRRQFAKMQKALFSDERVKKMAENPGNQAFLKTIEDRGSDDEMDFLDVVEETQQDDSQSQEQSQDDRATQRATQQVVPASQPGNALADMISSNSRRSKSGRKPANIGEVRQTLSNLLEDDREGSVIPATEAGSDSEEEAAPSQAPSDKENYAPNPRRTAGNGIVDRISLKRNNSSNLSTSSSSRLAFAAGQASSSFKVPALLRRATTNSFMSTSATTTSSVSTTQHGSSGSTGGGFGDDAKVKRTAGKRSGVNAFARENEQRAKIQQSERRREERKAKGAERRIGVVGGLLGRGSFE